ncbi:HWE histidine kinase domain-containing protein [Pseudooceanicola sp. MF1-13]|uniref:HWE histidine kinase domain-containing protein n=1 Tax=Pseudooceanicola sp. MF1-13 TaxID=3379095 RepID=UPI0038912E7E
MPDPQTTTEQVQYDLTNCDREPIHILGQVQHFACLIAISTDWMITHASENCQDLIGHDAHDLVGTRFIDLFPEETIHFLRTRMQVLNQNSGAARVFAYPIFEDNRLYNVSISQSGRNIVFEFEPREKVKRSPDDGSTVQALIARVQKHTTIAGMSAEAARGLKILSGFDRVMVYQFNADDSGTVIAEEHGPNQESFMGLRYPASDIPKQARALYVKSLLRLISDVNGDTHAIYPERDPNGEPLDLSLTMSRAVSPIHLEYLRNMGVGASMSVSILRKGKLWGLFACHHDTPRHIDYETRSSVELFAQLFNYELAQVEMNEELAEVDRARSLHDRLMSQLSGDQSIVDVFDVFSSSIKEVIPFDGIAVYSDGDYRQDGSTPTKEEFMGLARFLNTTPAGQVYSTQQLAKRYPAAEAFGERVAGILVLPISRTPRDYLVLFRREITASVNWAGNPEKPVELGPNGSRLTPRKSFKAWQEIVRGQSAPWRSSELRAADALRVTLLEVVLKMADQRNEVRRRAQDQQELLIAELNHRVRNILNLIRGLVSQGKNNADSVDAYRQVLDARIYALARAHDQLTQSEWDWVPLRGLVETEVKAFLTDKASRVSITGDEVDLSPGAFTTMALVIHELVTNSAKYGALNDSSGSVTIDVHLDPDGVARLTWREYDGPPVQAPTRRGFGTTIIERSIPYELKGTAEVHYKVTGLEADFTLPGLHVRAVKSAPVETDDMVIQAVPEVEMSGHCLVLEDNMVIALDASDMLAEMGADFVSTASRVSDAFQILQSQKIAFALLDVNLGDETSLPVVRHCLEKGIPAILATGYGSNTDLVEQFPTVPILKKPYTIESLRETLAAMDL